MTDELIGTADVNLQYALLVDPDTARELNLCRYATALGRSISCDVVITHKSVSRQHAFIYGLKGRFYIEDAGSTNGTIVNGKGLNRRVELKSGDEVRLGCVKLVFLLIPDRTARIGVFIGQEKAMQNERVAPECAASLRSVRL